jgi:hypothetical protein
MLSDYFIFPAFRPNVYPAKMATTHRRAFVAAKILHRLDLSRVRPTNLSRFEFVFLFPAPDLKLTA